MHTPALLHEKADGKLSTLFRSSLDVNFLLFSADSTLIANGNILAKKRIMFDSSSFNS